MINIEVGRTAKSEMTWTADEERLANANSKTLYTKEKRDILATGHERNNFLFSYKLVDTSSNSNFLKLAKLIPNANYYPLIKNKKKL